MKKEKIINVMKRYEIKYCLSVDQLNYFLSRIGNHMKVDKYGLVSIASIYYDTKDYQLINKSIEKPPFKEKIRLRSYGLAKKGSPVYLEIKRKYEDIVYKRRIETTENEVNEYLSNDGEFDGEQISRELVAFKEAHKGLEAKYLIIYDRVAYYEENSDLRITIDQNPRYRTSDLNLHTSLDGIPLLKEGGAILEVKVQHSIPLWLSKILTEGKIYKSSISKVGTAHKLEMKKDVSNIYQELIVRNMNKEGEQYGFII